VVITDTDIREAISHSVDQLIEAIREVLETTPPEILSDVMQNGIYVTGGGALIKGLPEVLSQMLHLKVHVADDPLTAMVRGAGIILEDIDRYKDILVSDEDGFLPTARF
jgi:rod shape-determining protein MreB